ncbi:DUF1007 family protein [Campylobacter coli]
MRAIFVLIFLALSNLYSCALCATYTPNVDVNLDFNMSNEKIKQVDISWEFSEEFFNILLENYDFNYNDKFDPDELEIVKYTLLDYIKPKHFLTQFSFNGLEENINIKQFKNPKLQIKSPRLFFSYQVVLDMPIKDYNTFSIKIHDDGGFFNFNIKNQNSISLNSQNYIISSIDSSTASFEVYQGQLPQDVYIDNAPSPSPSKNFLEKLIEFNNTLFAHIKDILRKEFDFKSFLILLVISFAYGVFHASAPGHAKMLTSSYFLTHKSTPLKILYFVSRIGVIHILSAFLLVSVGVVLLEHLLKDVNNEAGFVLTKITSLFIIFITLFMISKKILSDKKQCCCAHHKSNEWGIILSAALVPCPGVVLLIVFAYEFSFWYALSSAIFITLGMCLVLFAFALGANQFYKSISHTKIRIFLEYFGLIVMFLFGLFLFINIKTNAL